MVVRSLLTLLGFQSDTKQLGTYKKALDGIIKATKIAAVATIALGTAAFKTAGDMEQVEIAFETMLGSAEKANKLIEEITQFAATTPFELKGLVDSSKQLLAFGIDAENIINKMTVLGDISAGVGRDKLPTLVRSFGKIRTKGKATMEELNMMLEAGVPILDQLAKNLGVTQEELFKMISKGQVLFKDVDKALTDMATGTGKFAGLMKKQSKSFLGIISNIGDFLYNLSVSIGKDLLPIGKELAKFFLDFLQQNRELIKSGLVKFLKNVIYAIVFVILFIKRLIDRIGGIEKIIEVINNVLKNIGESLWAIGKIALEVFVFLFDTINKIVNVFGGWENVLSILIPLIITIVAALKIWSIIQAILNAVMLANPAGLITIAVVALAVALFFLVKTIIDVIKKIRNNWGKFVEWWKSATEKIGIFFKNVWNAIFNFFKGVWEKIVWFVLEVVKVFVNIFNGFIQFWKTVWNVIKEFFENIWNGFTETVSTIWEGVKNIILGVWQSITEGIKNLWQGAVDFVMKLWQGILDFINGIKNFAEGVGNFFAGLFGGGKKSTVNMNNPPAGAVATSTAGGMTNSTVIESINIGVPAGTPAEQKQNIETNVKKAVKETYNSYMREGLVNFAGGFSR